MASFYPCVKNHASGYTFYVSLVSQANTKIMQVSPTLAAGDVKVAIDDGAPANLGTLPVVDADYTKRVKVVLSQSEINGDNLTIVFNDASGAEWCDLTINIQTVPRRFDDLAYPATSGRSMVVDASGLVDANAVKVGPTGSGTAQTAGDIVGDTNDIQTRLPAALVSGRIDASVGAVANAAITAAAIATDAIDADALAADALAEINAEVDVALNTAIPGSPTADSINERIKTLDDNYTSTKAGYLDAAITSRHASGAAVASVSGAVDSVTNDVGITQTGADKVWGSAARTLTTVIGVKKNTALAAFPFLMRDSTDHVTPKTGLTVTAQRSLDGAAFAACANAVVEIGSGWYKVDLATTDVNADTVALKFTATGGDPTEVSFKTNS